MTLKSAALDRASAIAFKRLEDARGDLASLPEPSRIVAIIYSAKGVIDNGGFEYFFESDWPGRPPYSLFSDAYRRIGADVAAECIAQATSLFPFADPHLAGDRRRSFIASLPKHSEFLSLGDSVCGDRRVWEKLEAYVKRHESAF